MNTVLDDNKMLCLANSERIKFTPFMHMVFEVQDLAVASPATVSRCGMVYIDSNELGWLPYVKTWMKKFEDKFGEVAAQYLLALFEKYVGDGLTYVAKKCTQTMKQVSSLLNTSCSTWQSSCSSKAVLLTLTGRCWQDNDTLLVARESAGCEQRHRWKT